MKDKSYGLALGGGGARGYMHIGVIKYIEEYGIKINEVAGTSIGSLIGSMYAIGMSADQIEDTFEDVNFRMFFDAKFSNGLFGGNKILKRLQKIFKDKTIEGASLPCSIIAADVHTGEEKVFTSGLFSEAIRASMSLPGMVAPYSINDTEYIDGGVVNNLPIDTVESDAVIASSCVDTIYDKFEEHKKFLGIPLPHSAFKNASKVVNNSIQIMLKSIEDLTMEKSTKTPILIRPDLKNFTMFDIQKLDEIISIGYESMKTEWESAQKE